MRVVKQIAVRAVRFVNYLGSGLAIRLVKWTGKSSQAIHPKHLVDQKPEWLKYFNQEDEVLDIGCDNGQRDFKLAPFVRKITALDYQKEHVDQAQEWQKKHGSQNIDFLVLSAENKLPFSNNQFDKILFLDVLEPLNNRQQIMKECFRTLKPGGLMILAVPNSQTPWKKFQKSAGLNYYSDPNHKIEYTEEEIIREHQKSGFKIKEIKPIVYDFPLAGLIDLVGGISLSLYKKLWQWKYKRVNENPSASIGFMVVSEK